MSEIKWAYDSKTGSFSALPASPFLLLAIGAIVLLPLLEEAYYKNKFKPVPHASNFDPILHEQYRRRWKQLNDKKAAGAQLTWEEIAEISQMQNPPWRQPEDSLYTYS
jgi:hypothetical protein